MKLREHLTKTGITHEAFAAAVTRGTDPRPTSPSTVTRWANERRRPGAAMIARIYEVTAGAVGPADWFELPELHERSSSSQECVL